MKKRKRHTPEQIIRKLDEGHRQLAAGKDLDEVCRHLEIAESTWHRWVAQYGGMKASMRSDSRSSRARTPASRSCWLRPSWTSRC